jgi:hypothetical protein
MWSSSEIPVARVIRGVASYLVQQGIPGGAGFCSEKSRTNSAGFHGAEVPGAVSGKHATLLAPVVVLEWQKPFSAESWSARFLG